MVAAAEPNGDGSKKTKSPKKTIKGNLPYTPAPGIFKKTLEGMVTAGQPERFTSNFMDTVLGVTGPSARYVPPLLKKMGFLKSDGIPTELYTTFRTEGSRSAAAFDGLKRAFAELFQRNEFIHRASETEIRDQILAITGLAKGDAHVNYILATFKTLRDFIIGDPATQPKVQPIVKPEELPPVSALQQNSTRIGLVNNINIVLPESTNISVYNIIFQSLRANLLS